MFRKLYDGATFELNKTYAFASDCSLSLFAQRSQSMRTMANAVQMQPFTIVKVMRQALDSSTVYIQYQLEHMGAIRSAHVDKRSVVFFERKMEELQEGAVYRVDTNFADIKTLYGIDFWNHVGVHSFTIVKMDKVPNPMAALTLRLVYIRNHLGQESSFSMHTTDADFFTLIKGETVNHLPKKKCVDSKPEYIIVKSLELAPIRNEKERLEAIKLLEGIRYETDL